MDVPSTALVQTLSWRVVVPVKDARIGKTRLGATVPGADEQLRRAIAEDTLAAVVAAIGAEATFLVTSDPELGRRWGARGVSVCDDPGDGLNEAISTGLRRARCAPHPAEAHGATGSPSRLAALLGDLPALLPSDLLAALEQAAGHEECFVPDRQGVGTVLRCGSDDFLPRFGPGSAAAHEADGAVRLALDLPRLRTDVDDLESLLLARGLGVGPHTRSALARLALG